MIELAKTTVVSSVSEETSKYHAHDDVTHAMSMTRTGLRAVGRCGRIPYDYNKDSRDSVNDGTETANRKKAH